MPSPRHGEMRRKGLRQKGRACNLPDMKEAQVSPLAVLRLAAPGAPSLREISRVCGVSASALSMFEQGRYSLGSKALTAYSKAVGQPARVVRERFLQASAMYHQMSLRRVRDELTKLGSRRRKGVWNKATTA
jgi:transcriptional regulator with XRE-family HTH domain